MSLSFTSLAISRTAFSLVDCARCQTRVLTWVDDVEGQPLRRCLGCNAPLPEGADIVPASQRMVEALGYVFLTEARKSPKAQKLSGCGPNGVRSCGTGGCSSGSCGTGGGCSGGGCG